jgi:hypothetical protein
MRTFKFSFYCLILFVLASCGTDPIDNNPTSNKPTVTFGGNAGANATVNPCEELVLPINASKATSELNAIEVLEDGVKVDVSRITFKGSPAAANPILLFGADRSTLTNVELKVKASCNSGDKTISVSIIDAGQNKTTVNKKVTTNAVPPTIKYTGPDSIALDANGKNLFRFDVTKGSGKLYSLEVQENGVKLPVNRFDYEGTIFTSNPGILPASANGGFVGKGVTVTSNAAPGVYKYLFIFRDSLGLSTQKEIKVSIGKAFTFSKFGVFWNQSGPNGGGFDLDEALTVAYTSSLAEIADNGIDSTQTDKLKNWKQTVQGVNGTEIRLLKKGAEVEASWTLASLKYTEQIQSLFGLGKSAANQKIVKGDIIVAKKASKYYILEVANVIVTPSDNEDKYEVNIRH